MEVSYHDSAAILQAHDWQAPSPFQRSEWFALQEKHTTEDCLIAVAADNSSAACMPLVRRNGRLESLINWYSFQWLHVTSGATATEQEPALSSLCTGLAQQARRMTLWPVPEEYGQAARLFSALENAGWFVDARPCDINHHLIVGERSYQQYLATRPGQLRTTIRRKSKKLSTEIISIFSDDTWDIYQEIYENSWKPEEGLPNFLREFAAQESTAGRLRMGFAHHRGQPVAAQLWTVENGTAFIHKLGHRKDADGLSPGTCLTAAMLEHTIDRDRVACVDFGAGDDTYKRDWMERTRRRWRFDCHRRSHPLSWLYMQRHRLWRLHQGGALANPPAQSASGATEMAVQQDRAPLENEGMETEPTTKGADQTLRAVLVDVLGLDPEKVQVFTGDTGLFGYLPELDSMAVAGLLTEIEDRLDIIIDDDDVDGEMLETFGALLAFVEAKLAAS